MKNRNDVEIYLCLDHYRNLYCAEMNKVENNSKLVNSTLVFSRSTYKIRFAYFYGASKLTFSNLKYVYTYDFILIKLSNIVHHWNIQNILLWKVKLFL